MNVKKPRQNAAHIVLLKPSADIDHFMSDEWRISNVKVIGNCWLYVEARVTYDMYPRQEKAE